MPHRREAATHRQLCQVTSTHLAVITLTYPLHFVIAVRNARDSALEAARARHKYKLRKTSGEDDNDDAEEDIAEEQLERSSDTASGYLGVTSQGSGWEARCRIGGKERYIGSFAR